MSEKQETHIGNVAKMLEALELCVKQMSDAICDKDFGDDVVHLVGCMKTCIEYMKVTLAAHPRNCDRFGSEPEMRAAFIAYYNEAYDLKGSKYEIDTCDLKHDVDGILHEYINWLFSPEKLETKGATDGSK